MTTGTWAGCGFDANRCWTATDALGRNPLPYPAHWGKPPRQQTEDVKRLPGDYGKGSSTLYVWIKQHLHKDSEARKAILRKVVAARRCAAKGVKECKGYTEAKVKACGKRETTQCRRCRECTDQSPTFKPKHAAMEKEAELLLKKIFTQRISFAHLNVTEWVGTVKEMYEAAYGASIGIYSEALPWPQPTPEHTRAPFLILTRSLAAIKETGQWLEGFGVSSKKLYTSTLSSSRRRFRRDESSDLAFEVEFTTMMATTQEEASFYRSLGASLTSSGFEMLVGEVKGSFVNSGLLTQCGPHAQPRSDIDQRHV